MSTPKMVYRILYFLSFVVLSCGNDMKKIKATIDRNALNVESAENVKIVYSKDGDTKALLETKRFTHQQFTQPTYIEMKEGLKVTFYSGDSISSILTAKYGKLFEDNNNILVRDSVQISNYKNEHLFTEELIWDDKLQQFYTEKFVKITTPTQVIYGNGLESNKEFTVYKIKQVQGIIGITKQAMKW